MYTNATLGVGKICKFCFGILNIFCLKKNRGIKSANCWVMIRTEI